MYHKHFTQSKKININPKTTKNKGKNKTATKFLFICCGPVGGMEASVEPRPQNCGGRGAVGGGDKFVKYVKAESKDGAVHPEIIHVLSLPPGEKEKETVVSDQRSKGSKRIKRLLKAVVLGTSLAKKIKRRKAQRKLNQLNGKESIKIVEDDHINTPQEELVEKNVRIINKVPSSCSYSSIPEGNQSCRSNWMELKQKQDNLQDYKTGCYDSNTGLYLILVSLSVLVFWGKACAILCASTWLFFVPRWNSANNSS